MITCVLTFSLFIFNSKMRENLTRWLYQAMGFQNGLARTQRIESISKATKLNKTEPKEESKPADQMDISNDVKYISWLVSQPTSHTNFFIHTY